MKRPMGESRAGDERWRVFCAVELPAEVRALVSEHIARLREATPEVRASWERTEKIHLTLKFLGEVESNRVAALSRAASRATENVEAFELAIEGAGAFPPRGQPRVLWLGVDDPAGGLSVLQQSLENECAAEGFAREERSFHPHITIARLRTPQGAHQLANLHRETSFPQATFTVNELVVMRSELAPGGSRYTVLSRHEFK